MAADVFADRYPDSPAYQGLQPLRIPTGWRIGWNKLYVAMADDRTGICGYSQFNAADDGDEDATVSVVHAGAGISISF